MSERATPSWRTSYRAALVQPVTAAPIIDGAVLVEGDRIAWVGHRRDHPPTGNARVVELGDVVLAPGLVNAHTHLDLTVLRGLLHGLTFFDWIRAVVDVRHRLTANEWLDSARLGVIEALASGITTIGDTAPTAAAFEAMREHGVRGLAYLEVFGPDPAQAGPSLADLAGRVNALRSRETRLVRVGVSPHAPYSVADELYASTAAWARQNGLPIATHVAESVAESDLVAHGNGPFAEMLRRRGILVAPRGRSPIALLDRLGVLGADSLLIHCVQCDAADLAAIGARAAPVVACPMSNRYFGHGDAPWRVLRTQGLAMGSDSLASNDAMDMLREARIAEGHATNDCTSDDTWRMATLSGAHALGLSDETGSLDVGKQADLAAFPIPHGTTDTRQIVVGPRATLTVVAGVERVREGRVLTDVEAVRGRLTAATQRLREWRKGITSL